MTSTPEPGSADEAADEADDVPAPPAHPALPVTGHRAIDEALAALEVGDDVHTHHDEVAATLEVIQQALNPRSQPPLPGR